MKDRFKAGDKVKRKADQMDGWWLEQCRYFGIKPDTIFEVVEYRANGGVLLKGHRQGYEYTGRYFELVEVSEEAKMREAYELAKSLIGKTVTFDDADTKYTTVTGIIFRQDTTDDGGLGWSCNKFLKENGWLVGVKFNSLHYPVQMVSEVPTELNVQLNGSFAATITKGKVKINGVTFPIERIQEIIDAHNKL